MVKKIIAFVAILIMAFSLIGCFNCSANGKADWDVLYDSAADWGYNGNQDTFVAILLGLGGEKNHRGNAKLSAYEIYKKYHPDYTGDEEEWKNELINGKLAGLFSLQDAHDNGWLTQENVMSIVYYSHLAYGEDDLDEFYSLNPDISPSDFTPTPKNPETLNEKTKNRIKSNYMNKYHPTYDKASLEDKAALEEILSRLEIDAYCGIYNGCIVVRLSYTRKMDALATPIEINVAGVFLYAHHNGYIYIWKY